MLMEGFHKGEAKGRFPITYHLTQLEIPAATYFCQKVFQKVVCLDWVMSYVTFIWLKMRQALTF